MSEDGVFMTYDDSDVYEGEALALKRLKEVVSKVVELDAERKRLKSLLADVDAKLANAKAEAMPFYEQTGINSMKTNDKNVYLLRNIHVVMGENRINAVEELMKLGMKHFVTINHQSFKAYVSELAREHGLTDHKEKKIIGTCEEIRDCLPGKLGNLLNITESFDLRVIKA